MKNLALIIFFIIICPSRTILGAEWEISTDLGLATAVNVTAITAVDKNNVWAAVDDVEGEGEILHYDGINWSLQTTTYSIQTGEHRGAYAFDQSNVWVVGNSISPQQGRIYYYNGSIWNLQTDMTGNSTILYGVYAPSAGEVWVTGNSGRIHHSADGGVSWDTSTDTGSDIWQGIHGIDNSNIWVVGNSNPAQILYWNGSIWSIQTEVDMGYISAYLREVSAYASDDVWAAGDLGMVLHYDGESWNISTDVSGGTIFNYAPISAMTNNRVWAAPRNGTGGIFSYNGSDWTLQTSFGPIYEPVSLEASVPLNVWAGAERCRIYHLEIPSPSPIPTAAPSPTPNYVTQNWTLSTEIPGERFYSVAAGDIDSIWIPSGTSYPPEAGRIFFNNGSSWAIQTTAFSTQSGTFRGIFALDSTHVWAVGNAIQSTRGRIYFKNEGDWQLQTTMESTSTYLYDAYAVNATNVWVVGNSGFIYNTTDGGTTWSIHTKIGVSIWSSIHGTDENNIWAVGCTDPSRIAYFDGSTWSIQCDIFIGTGKYLRGVTVISPTDVWAVGDDGLILHYIAGDWTIAEDVGDTSNYANIAARSSDSIWAGFAGLDGGLYYYNGSQWSIVQGINLATAYDIDTSAPYHVWATGDLDEAWVLTIPTPTPSSSPSPTPTNTLPPTPVSPTPTIPPPSPSTPSPTTIPVSPTPVATPSTAPSPTCGPSIAYQDITIANGDYNADGLSDIAIYRRASGLWAIRGITRVYFGTAGDIPVAGDYTGDKTTEVAIYRPPSGLWAIRGISRIYFGNASDIPSPADYDGDGIIDIAIYRGSAGLWALRLISRIYFGNISDRPIPADYDGDGITDPTIMRPVSGLWAIRGISRIYFGTSNDWCRPGDYNGDGTDVPAVYRPGSGLWAARGITRSYFGCCFDWPVPADFNGDDTDDIGIFRKSSGLWAIRSLTRLYYGSTTDIPVTR